MVGIRQDLFVHYFRDLSVRRIFSFRELFGSFELLMCLGSGLFKLTGQGSLVSGSVLPDLSIGVRRLPGTMPDPECNRGIALHDCPVSGPAILPPLCSDRTVRGPSPVCDGCPTEHPCAGKTGSDPSYGAFREGAVRQSPVCGRVPAGRWRQVFRFGQNALWLVPLREARGRHGPHIDTGYRGRRIAPYPRCQPRRLQVPA